VDLRIIELEVFFIAAIFYQLSYELITMIRDGSLFISHMDGTYGLIFKILTMVFLVGVAREDSIRGVDPHYITAPMIIFSGIIIILAIDIL